MRLGYLKSGRPHYYDRNPASQMLNFSVSAVGPQNGIPFTYTCPSTKKAYVQGGGAKVTRATAAGVLDVTQVLQTVLPSGGGNGTVVNLASLRSNTVGASDGQSLSSLGLIAPGESFRVSTNCGDTGGTCDYFGSVWIIEFDA